jgi:hypothetical protein
MEMSKKKIELGEEVTVAHPIIGTLSVKVLKKDSDEDGDYWMGIISSSSHMGYCEPVKFRMEDVLVV